MGFFLQQVLTIASLGAIYALAAAGYTLIHGVTRQFNLALGGVYMLGAYAAFLAMTLADIFGLPLGLGIAGLGVLASMAIGAALGVVVDRFAVPVKPQRGENPVAPLVTTVGLAIVFAEIMRLRHEPHTLFVPPSGNRAIGLGVAADFPVTLLPTQIFVFVAATAAVALTAAIMRRSRAGRAWRAVADDPLMAGLLGLSVARVLVLTAVAGCALTAAAGALATVRYGAVDPYMGLLFGLKAIAAAIIGGIGSVGGAVLGALIIATAETFWSAYLPGDWRDVVVFALLIGALIFFPAGLFRRPAPDAALGAGGARR